MMQNSILFTMAPVILILAGGYFVGGMLGDWAFKKNVRGRIIVSSIGVLLGAIFLYMAINTPVMDKTQFFILMALTALFMPLSSPNVLATIFDITPPEVRSTAQAVEYFVESSGAALAPVMAGFISDEIQLADIHLEHLHHLLVTVFHLLSRRFVYHQDRRPLTACPDGRTREHRTRKACPSILT